MLTRIDDKWTQTDYLIFKDLGPVSVGSRTHAFNVQNRNGTWIGTVKWFNQWRRYCFFPVYESVHSSECLRDIADFCDEETKRHKDKKNV